MKIDYQALLDESMIDLVKKVLIIIQDQGLDEDQSFYVSFRTNLPDVVLSKRVRQQYPEEITIVLQYQFRDLYVLPDRFSVNIAFSGRPETIEIPFNSITSFVDPVANFSLQFRKYDQEADAALIESVANKIETEVDKPEKKAGQIVAIDAFRKKKK
jgi:uncharacterized protein